MPHDIFISYSRRDLAAVQPIKEELEVAGFSCWIDLQGIESGSEEFTDKIAAAIEGSSTTLFFLSDGSQESRWSLNDLRVARDEGKHVVLVRFNDDRMKIKFKLEFGGSDIIDWRKPEQREKFLANLESWCGKDRKTERDRNNPLDMLDGASWVELILVQPLMAIACPFDRLDGKDLCRLVAIKPEEFAEKCPWEKLNVNDWIRLLSGSLYNSIPSRFVDRCPWEKLTGNGWATLLSFRPQYAEKCLWEKLGVVDWKVLLVGQPQFADKCPPEIKKTVSST